jgi:hypothetical protein
VLFVCADALQVRTKRWLYPSCFATSYSLCRVPLLL